ncbi:hypothetical protein V491_07680 [Pseudogymnoascus sp. VKM F-3775]|nr:hypothetical protein V491_07680 [Pseudogymnoascus sp. VKM F-3775]
MPAMRVPLQYGEILPVEGPIPVLSPYLKQPQGPSLADSGGEQFAASLPSDREASVEMDMSSFLSPANDGYYAARRLGLREEGRMGSVIAETSY